MSTEPKLPLRCTRAAAVLVLALVPELPAQATGSASGLVVDSLLRPIPVARVEASLQRDPWTSIRTTATDGTGQFVLGGLPFAHLWLRCSADGQTTEYLDVELRPRLAMVFGLYCRLLPAAPVSGRVVDAAGEAVAGAAVVLLAASVELAGDGRSETVTDARGAFRCDDVALGPVNAWVHARGHGLFGPVRINDRERGEIRWQASEGRSLRLRVTGIDGTLLPRSVTVVDRANGFSGVLPRGMARVELDANGIGEVHDLPPRRALWVRGSSDGATFGSVLVDARAAEATVPATPFVRVSVSGRVLAEDGQPLNGVVVSAAGPGLADTRQATTDGEGRFAFEQAMPAGGKLGLRLWGNELALAPTGVVYLRGSTNDLELRAVRTVKLSGRVVDARGAPVPGAIVRLVGGPSWSLPTDGDGRFLFDRITDTGTPVSIEVESPFGTVQTGRVLELRNGEHVDGGSLELSAPARLEGVVRDAQGRPVGGASVVLRPEATQSAVPAWATITDDDGRFVAQTSVEGNYRVLVQHGKDDGRTVVQMQRGTTQAVELTVQ